MTGKTMCARHGVAHDIGKQCDDCAAIALECAGDPQPIERWVPNTRGCEPAWGMQAVAMAVLHRVLAADERKLVQEHIQFRRAQMPRTRTGRRWVQCDPPAEIAHLFNDGDTWHVLVETNGVCV